MGGRRDVVAVALAGVLVVVSAIALAALSLLLFLGYCNEDIDLDDAAGCEEDPTWLFPLPIGANGSRDARLKARVASTTPEGRACR